MATTAQIQRTIQEIDRLLSAHTEVKAESDSPERKKLADSVSHTAAELDKALAEFKKFPSHNGNDGNWEKLIGAMGKYRQAKSKLDEFDKPQSEKDKEWEERRAHLKRLESGQKETGYKGEERRSTADRRSEERTTDRRTSGAALVASMTAMSNKVMAERPSDVFSDMAFFFKKGKEALFPPRAIKILKLQLEEAEDHLDAVIETFKKKSGDNNLLNEVVVALKDYQSASARYAIAVMKHNASKNKPVEKTKTAAKPKAEPFRGLIEEAKRAAPAKKAFDFSVDLARERTASLEARVEQVYGHLVKTGKLPA